MIDKDWLELLVKLAIEVYDIDESWGNCKKNSEFFGRLFKQIPGSEPKVVDPCSVKYLQPEACEVWGTGHRVLVVENDKIVDTVAKNSNYYKYFKRNVYNIEEYKKILINILRDMERELSI